MLCFLAEEEWIEEQLALNPDFDPNAEAGTNNGTDDQQNDASSNHAAGQNGTTEKVDQTANGEGENMDELPPKPKRYVSPLDLFVVQCT